MVPTMIYKGLVGNGIKISQAVNLAYGNRKDNRFVYRIEVFYLFAHGGIDESHSLGFLLRRRGRLGGSIIRPLLLTPASHAQRERAEECGKSEKYEKSHTSVIHRFNLRKIRK
jgi:hypothetical protein